MSLSIDAEEEKDLCKGQEMRELNVLNDTKIYLTDLIPDGSLLVMVYLLDLKNFQTSLKDS